MALTAPNVALALCPNNACVYPFNLSMAQIQASLMEYVDEGEVVARMAAKVGDAQVQRWMRE